MHEYPVTRGQPRALAFGYLALVCVLTAHLPASAAAQGTGACLAAEGLDLELGWRALRTGAIAGARRIFTLAQQRCPGPESLTGLGYVALRAGDLAAARTAFDQALAAQPDSYDALTGRALVAWRETDLTTARRRFARALELVPGDSLASAYLARLPAPIDTSPFPRRSRPSQPVVVARARDRRIEVHTDSGFRPLWVKAVNIGAALPGKHPSEFPPDDGTYEQWLAVVDSMGANAVRVYTIHPPHFYRALARWNATHPARPLWLIHGVWTELPPGSHESEYDDPAWLNAFQAEMRRVVDLVHGHAIIPPRPGHAAGRYDADVSPWTLGWIIGREWEPYSVVDYARRHPQRRDYTGRFVSSHGGHALESWLAAVSDYMLAYEMDQWNTQRPLAYTNWPTLDPLTHPTESTQEEESRWRRRRGEELSEANREYDNDAIGLDARHMVATDAYPAGVFASYHAYPYYPDFMVQDPGYLRAQSPEGPSAYYGYLRELVAHHGDMPVIISEVGVPSSRGNAHLQPQGWHHGGHDEAAQATINARLVRDIHASDAAGVGLFALIDEWFKKNWLTIDFEQPLERNRLWLNALDAEQNYGVIAMRPGHQDSVIVIDGDTTDWKGRGRWYAHAPADTLPLPLQLRHLHVTQDEGWVYLQLGVGAIDWSRGRYLIGISTVGDSAGDHRLPHTGTRVPMGLEFVLDLRGPADTRLLIDTPYTLFRRAAVRGSRDGDSTTVYNRPFRSVPNADGRYDTLRVTPNRRRIFRDGTVMRERSLDWNLLRHARQQETTLADWYADSATGIIELRLPWGMLHVLDPSSGTVLQGSPRAHDPEGVTTPGFRFIVQSYAPAEPARGGDLLSGGGAMPPLWHWPGWEVPRWHAELKPVFHALRETFRRLDAAAPPIPARR